MNDMVYKINCTDMIYTPDIQSFLSSACVYPIIMLRIEQVNNILSSKLEFFSNNSAHMLRLYL